jgi:oligopeptide transport system permease protein
MITWKGRHTKPAHAAQRPRGLWAGAGHRLIRQPAALLGLIYLVAISLTAIAAPWLAPHDPLAIFPGNSYRPVAWVARGGLQELGGSWAFPLGCDSIGRDVLSRVIFGARTSVIAGILPAISVMIVGGLIGLIAGYSGGPIDALLMRVADLVYAFPGMLFFIVVMAATRDTPLASVLNGFPLLMTALTVVAWPGIARLVRGQTLALREREFIMAAHALGLRRRDVLWRHILPNVVGALLIMGSTLIPAFMMAEATLAYLGVGAQPGPLFPTSWGALLLDGKAGINAQPWLLIAPALALASVTLACTAVSDGLRDSLDVRL